MMDWKSKKIAVLGLGIEGLSSMRFLHKKGINVTVLDRREKEEIDKNILSEAKEYTPKFIMGEGYLEKLSDFDVVIRAPGFRRDNSYLIDAEKKGAVVTSLTRMFFDLCPCPIVGVTGTKGKGTTSTLIYEMLKDAGQDVYLGGNIGTPPLDFLEQLNKDSIVVLELSSFQLLDLNKSPHIAVMLMVTSEHLDYHKDVFEYIDAKRNILRFQTQNDFAVVNRDYPASNESDVFTDGKVFYVSSERTGKDGIFIKDNSMWVSKEGQEKKIIDTKNILLPGRHNIENAAAAALVATLCNVGRDSIEKVLRTFKGLPHRIELVSEINGARYFDDSFSTTPETAIAAIEAFSEPEILILGGSSKNSDFTELGKVINNTKNIKAIIGIGDEWWEIKSKIDIENSKILLVEDAKDMKTIVAAAFAIAKSGDVVLLSPACASFGMFKNYKDRGEQFKSAVLALEEPHIL